MSLPYKRGNPKRISIEKYMLNNTNTTDIYKKYKEIDEFDISSISFATCMNTILPSHMKYCSKCDRILDVTCFGIGNGSRGRHTICKDCKNDYSFRYNRHIRNGKRRWCSATLSSHRKRFEVNISVDELHEYVSDIDTCNLCGVKLKWEQGNGFTPESPTLDRKFNDREINIDNIQVLCYACNTGKGAGTNEEYINKCRDVVQLHDAKHSHPKAL